MPACSTRPSACSRRPSSARPSWRIINSVQEALASKLDMQAIYDLVGDKIREIFNAQMVDIRTYDPPTDLTALSATRTKRASGSTSADDPLAVYGFRSM